MVLRALDGKYIVSGNIVDVYDRFRIRVTDLGSNTYDRYFEVTSIIPSVTKSQGSLLTIDCIGIEYNTMQIQMSRPYWFEDAYTVVRDIANYYNRHKGDDQPWISNHDVVWLPDDGLGGGNTVGNGAPFYTANNYEYGLNEDRCYNRWMDVLEKLGASVSAGGALTFYELSFVTTGVNAMDMKFRPSGDNATSGTLVTVKNAKVTNPKNVGEQEGVLENPTGTHVVAWGSNDHGTLPYEYSKYFGEVEAFLFRPEWQTGVYYEAGSKIKVTDDTTQISKHYEVKAGQGHTSGASTKPETGGSWATYWAQIDQKGEFGDSVQYSPWTDDKARVISNCGADPTRSTYTNGAWFDCNIVIHEEEFFRTWVDATAYSDTDLGVLDNTYSYEVGDTNYFPNGFRVLVNNSSPSGELANFANMVVEYRKISETNYTWKKLYSFSSDQDKAQVVDLDTGKIYEYDNGTTSWSTIETSAYGNDCIHPYTTAPANVNGFDNIYSNATLTPRSEVTDNTNFPDITDDGTAFTQNIDSAIKFVSTATTIAASAFSWVDGNSDYYKAGIGFNFRFPYPNETTGISEKVGELYGGGGATTWTTSTAYVRGDKVINGTSWYMCVQSHTSGTFATDRDTNHYWQLYFPEPSVLDIQNMNYARDGQTGWNADDSVLDLGQISALAMWLRFSITENVGNNELDDEHRFRAWMCDTKDNVVYQDFSLSHSKNWSEVILPISGFKIYRGRKPLYGIDAAIAAFIPPKELEILNIFEWRNIKLMGVQYQPQYDEHGRFSPVNATISSDGTSVTWANLIGATWNLELDGLRFIKPLVAHSGEVEDRVLEPDFLQRPNITNFKQLENDAKSQLEIEKFQHKELVVETSGDDIFDIPFGDSFLVENNKIISDSDTASNTIQLVAKRIEYSITKPSSGAGGLRRKIQGAKVFT